MLDIAAAREGFRDKLISYAGFVRSSHNLADGLTNYMPQAALRSAILSDNRQAPPEQRIIHNPYNLSTPVSLHTLANPLFSIVSSTKFYSSVPFNSITTIIFTFTAEGPAHFCKAHIESFKGTSSSETTIMRAARSTTAT